ncbi:GNAT family N-acetyltransferase [bacterium]|nr:GNAT family N-acetyltransferase [bacterium]
MAVTVSLIDVSNPAQLRAFKELNEAWIERYFRIEPEDTAALTDPVTHILNPGGLIAVAEEDGNYIGACAMYRHKDGRFELTKMAVDESSQARGTGQKLAEFLLDEIQKLGADYCYIISNTKLERAIRLYRRLGFVDCPEDRHSRYERGNITLEKFLTASLRKTG